MGFRKQSWLACNPEHPQIRTRSLPEPASRAASSRPVHPVHPVHRCSIIKNVDPRGPDRCPPHRIPWERGRDARMLFLWRLLSFPAMLQAVILSAPHRPGRNKAMAPFPVDSSEGDGRGCAWLCAGGTPALPGSTHLMTSPHQGHHPAEAVWRRLSMEEVHLHSCPFVVHLH